MKLLFILFILSVIIIRTGKIKIFTFFLNYMNIILKSCSIHDNKPYYNHKILKECIILKDNWRIFRNEALGTYENYSTITNDLFFNDSLVDKQTDWTKLYIKWYSDIDDIALKQCPKSCEIIKKLPNIKLAMFSVLAPGTRIKAHKGLYKGCLRFHLGLSTPNSDNCFIVVDNKKYSWKDGEGILIDDTYEHWVHNNTDKKRIILFCDIVRPLNNIGSILNNFLINNLGKYTSREN